MGLVVEEVKTWNTPIVGGYLLWMFTRSYRQHHPTADAPVGILHFIAYAILMDTRLTKRITGHRKSLQSYVRGFSDEREVDLLVGLHDVVKRKRGNTMQAIDLGASQGLLAWDHDTGRIYATDDVPKAKRGRALRRDMSSLGKKAEMLGKWFAEHDVLTIASYLKVVL